MDAKLITVIVSLFTLFKKVFSTREHVSHTEVKDVITPVIQLGVDYATTKLTESNVADKLAEKVVNLSANRLGEEEKAKIAETEAK